jgi:restriction system protein
MELAIFALLAALVFISVALGAKYDRDVKAAEARKRFERNGTLVAGFAGLMFDHGPTLARRLHQLRYRDPYGNWMHDKWEKEVGYFFGQVLLPEFPEMNPAEVEMIFALLIKWVGELDFATFPEFDEEPAAALDGLGYERQVGAALARAGFSVNFTPATGDQGVDIIAEREGEKVAVQCKNYASAVGNDAVQQVFAGGRFYGASRTVVIAPNGYTTSAKQLASSLGVACLHHNEIASLLAAGALTSHS